MRCQWLGFIAGGVTLSVTAAAAAASIALRAPSVCGEGELIFRIEQIIGTPIAQAAPLHFDWPRPTFEGTLTGNAHEPPL